RSNSPVTKITKPRIVTKTSTAGGSLLFRTVCRQTRLRAVSAEQYDAQPCQPQVEQERARGQDGKYGRTEERRSTEDAERGDDEAEPPGPAPQARQVEQRPRRGADEDGPGKCAQRQCIRRDGIQRRDRRDVTAGLSEVEFNI